MPKIFYTKTEKFFDLPKYQTSGSAGVDLYAAEDVEIKPKTIAMVSTGLKIALPEGYEAQIRSRSGLASKWIIVINAPGTIDSDYRDEIKILLANLSDNTYKVERGSRIAQMVLSKYEKIEFEITENLNKTDRTGGFGSTGIN